MMIRGKIEIPPDNDPVHVPDDLLSGSDQEELNEDALLKQNEDLKKKIEVLKRDAEAFKFRQDMDYKINSFTKIFLFLSCE